MYIISYFSNIVKGKHAERLFSAACSHGLLPTSSITLLDIRVTVSPTLLPERLSSPVYASTFHVIPSVKCYTERAVDKHSKIW